MSNLQSDVTQAFFEFVFLLNVVDFNESLKYAFLAYIFSKGYIFQMVHDFLLEATVQRVSREIVELKETRDQEIDALQARNRYE